MVEKSKLQMTIESRLIDYLEDGDIVLADNSFSEIITVTSVGGKKVKIVLPPFLQNKNKFSRENI